MARATLTVGDVAERTGITVATLRAWERRYGFPVPHRQPSGHRRYTEDDCAALLVVQSERHAGRSLAAAIDRARQVPEPAAASVAARLRMRPDVPEPALVGLPTMLALSRAVEDEASTSAGRPVLAASFQTAAAYRRARPRWLDLAAGAEVAVVVAAFAEERPPSPPGGPVELSLPAGSPLRHEWVVASHGPTFTACLAGWERPTPPGTPAAGRLFEAVWTVAPDAARLAVETVLALGGDDGADLLAMAGPALDRPIGAHVGGVATAVSLANRMVAYVAGSADVGR